AASRLTVIVFARASPKIDRVCDPGTKVAVTAGARRSASGSSAGTKRRRAGLVRALRNVLLSVRFNHHSVMEMPLLIRKSVKTPPSWRGSTPIPEPGGRPVYHVPNPDERDRAKPAAYNAGSHSVASRSPRWACLARRQRQVSTE